MSQRAAMDADVRASIARFRQAGKLKGSELEAAIEFWTELTKRRQEVAQTDRECRAILARTRGSGSATADARLAAAVANNVGTMAKMDKELAQVNELLLG